jgi:hypothetical protein
LGGKLMFPSDYIAAIEFRGRDVTLTIAGVRVESLPKQNSNQKENKPVLTFRETRKKLILNKTNSGTIADIYDAPNAEEWIGKKITLYPTRTQVGREQRDCIRIRDTRPKSDTPLPDTMVNYEPEGPQDQEDDFLASVDNANKGSENIDAHQNQGGATSPDPASEVGAIGAPFDQEPSTDAVDEPAPPGIGFPVMIQGPPAVDPLDEAIDQGHEQYKKSLKAKAKSVNPNITTASFMRGLFLFVQHRGGVAEKVSRADWKLLYNAIAANEFDFEKGVIGKPVAV